MRWWWLYPNGTRILELYTTCKPAEAFQVISEARAFLSGRGVNLTGEQQTKTRIAIDFFSKQFAEGKDWCKSWSAP